MEQVLAAIVTGGFAVWCELVRRKINTLTSKVQTNHGKEPFEYLEMIAEVKAGQDKVVGLIAEHTVQDSVNFKIMDNRLAAIEARVTVAD